MDGELGRPPVARTLRASNLEVQSENSTIRKTYEGLLAFTNPMGQIQGGILSVMLDDTMALVLLSMLDEDEIAPTLELKVNFISPARVDKLEGFDKVVFKGKNLCLVEGELRQGKVSLPNPLPRSGSKQMYAYHDTLFPLYGLAYKTIS